MPMLVATGSVGLGMLLALTPGRSVVRPIKFVAAAAAVAAVVLVLLPEAVHEAGYVVLLVAVAGVSVPLLIERIGRESMASASESLALELGYAGLLVHQVGDGLALATVGGEHSLTLGALALHIVPVSALVAFTFREHKGIRHAALRCLGLMAALWTGVGLVGVMPVSWVHTAHPWVSAVAAGVLMHVVLHSFHDHGAISNQDGQ